jgi:hypothetical protein
LLFKINIFFEIEKFPFFAQITMFYYEQCDPKPFSKAKLIFKFNQNAFQIESDPILK